MVCHNYSKPKIVRFKGNLPVFWIRVGSVVSVSVLALSCIVDSFLLNRG